MSVAASQSLTRLSRAPVAIVRPSGLKATDSTCPRCPFRNPFCLRVAASEIRTVMSLSPVAIVLPSGEIAADHDQSWCIGMTARVVPVATSQSLGQQSAPAESRDMPSGAKATQ